ncbi:hypothetical protein TIFTF001_041826 [Ficus carica]|uniref:Uncharacterized protein n=1 Tax=Ficus carica TaxID=3494 RepID=A0AA87ZTU4_FICCA|nr:hypothetical protein TIFTF001_041826 [Ficus carica]
MSVKRRCFTPGFGIGLTCHRAFLDGKSTTMFMKSWADICRSEKPVVPPELTPLFDGSFIRYPDGLDLFYVKKWLALTKLTLANIAKLREKLLSSWDKPEKLRLTSLALTYSYIALRILRVTEDDFGVGKKNKFLLGFAVDVRSRLKPAFPENYFGNFMGLVASYGDLIKTLKESADEEPLTMVAAERRSGGVVGVRGLGGGFRVGKARVGGHSADGQDQSDGHGGV